MINAYINYPNPHITVHGNAMCAQVGKNRKDGQRQIVIAAESITREFLRFGMKHYLLGADARYNDMWLQIDFADRVFEGAVLAHIHGLIGVHYKPIARASIDTHC